MIAARMKPEVPKCWLFAVCGVMWSGVGLMMCVTGARWLASQGIVRAGTFELAGITVALIAFRLLFGSIARKNIQRLRRLPQKGCFFAFQAWKSYLIIAFMIALGVSLRHSPVPKTMLSVVYTGIGGALGLSSGLYYRYLTRLFRATSRRGRHR